MIGKPYSGKPNVRFDEGELEIELLATTPALYSTEVRNPLFQGLLPEVLFSDFYPFMQHFNVKSAMGVKFPGNFLLDDQSV
jgi:hypothetical protein